MTSSSQFFSQFDVLVPVLILVPSLWTTKDEDRFVRRRPDHKSKPVTNSYFNLMKIRVSGFHVRWFELSVRIQTVWSTTNGGILFGWQSHHFLKPKSSTRLESSDLTPKATTSVVLNYVFTSEEITSSFSGNSVVSMVSFMVAKWVFGHQ